MKDTAFSVPAAQIDQFAAAYRPISKPGRWSFTTPPKTANGAGRRHSRQEGAG
jgi:hypothetical protein